MYVIALYRQMAQLRARGLSETEIAVWCRVRQWTVSRVLALRTMDATVMRLFEEYGTATLAALAEVASWPKDVQRAALGDLARLVCRMGRTVERPDVAPVMARHARDLDRAPFPTTNCRACLRRTGAQMDFFGGVPEGLGRCLDAACFARNVNAVAMRRARWPKQLRANARKPKTEKERQ